MVLSGQLLTILVLVALGLAVLTLVLLGISQQRRRAPEISTDEQAVAMLSEHDQALSRLQQVVGRLIGEQRRQAGTLMGAIQRVGLVRYDAFDDMAGHLSFSAALLDEQGTGIIITSINGRQDNRCYAKTVRDGVSRNNLSDEEHEAIRRAMAGGSEPASESTAPAPVRLAAETRGRARPGA